MLLESAFVIARVSAVLPLTHHLGLNVSVAVHSVGRALNRVLFRTVLVI